MVAAHMCMMTVVRDHVHGVQTCADRSGYATVCRLDASASTWSCSRLRSRLSPASAPPTGTALCTIDSSSSPASVLRIGTAGAHDCLFGRVSAMVAFEPAVCMLFPNSTLMGPNAL